jgi:hypothetical protein
MREDYRQAAVAHYMTKRFEDDYVEWMHSLCFQDGELQTSKMKRLHEAANEAIVEQLNYYFVLHDFIIPAFYSVDARLTYQARRLAGEEVPANVVSEANKLVSLMKERASYKFSAPKEPFSLSVMKQYAARDIKTNISDGFNEVEKARRTEVILGTMERAFIGKKGDIEALIQCGVLKPSARTLIKPQEASEKTSLLG